MVFGPRQKTQVTLRIDTDVLNKFKATGAGWQSRINDALQTIKIGRCGTNKPIDGAKQGERRRSAVADVV
jgi:hypothetical protein